MIQLILSKSAPPLPFNDCRDAIDALSRFEAEQTAELAYQITPSFNAAGVHIGYRVEVWSFEGAAREDNHFIGYVTEA